MKLKRLSAFAVCLALAVSVTACGKEENGFANAGTATETTAETTVTTEAAEQETVITSADIDYSDEADFVMEEVDGGVAITEYIGESSVVNIPPTIGGKRVVKIGTAYEDENSKSPFWLTGVTDIRLPDGIKKVDESAFYECINIKSIYIPDGVTEIEKYAFLQCRALESIRIPDSVVQIGVFI